MSWFKSLLYSSFSFFFNAPATTEIYTLSLHDALPILRGRGHCLVGDEVRPIETRDLVRVPARSEEHTSELQSPYDLVCRLLLEQNNEDHRGDRVHDRRLILPCPDGGAPRGAQQVAGDRGDPARPVTVGGPVVFLMTRRRARSILVPHAALLR